MSKQKVAKSTCYTKMDLISDPSTHIKRKKKKPDMAIHMSVISTLWD